MLEFVRLLDIVCPTTFKAHLKNIQELEAPKIVLAFVLYKIKIILVELKFLSQLFFFIF